MTALELRDQGLLVLEAKGAILDVAREVSRALDKSSTPGAVIGGIAVVLHGHVRTTIDVGVFVPEPLQPFADHLLAAGFAFDAGRREFSRHGVPVRLVSDREADPRPVHLIDIESVRTVSLADLINLKLHSGMRSLVRAQDIADVIGLIRHHRLGSDFARKIDKRFRSEFRKLVRAIRREK